MDTCFGGLFNIRIFNKIDQWEFAIFILCMISLVAVWLDRNPSETWLLIVCSLSCILDLYLLFKMVTFDCKSSTILFLSHWQKQIMQILMNHQFRSVLSCYRDKILYMLPLDFLSLQTLTCFILFMNTSFVSTYYLSIDNGKHLEAVWSSSSSGRG